MPVNMTPKKKKVQPEAPGQPETDPTAKSFGQETDLDREKDIADAEAKNMWDQTEVIDMDTF